VIINVDSSKNVT